MSLGTYSVKGRVMVMLRAWARSCGEVQPRKAREPGHHSRYPAPSPVTTLLWLWESGQVPDTGCNPIASEPAAQIGESQWGRLGVFVFTAPGSDGKPRAKAGLVQLCQSAAVHPALRSPVPASAKQRVAASAEASVSLLLCHCYATVTSFLSL